MRVVTFHMAGCTRDERLAFYAPGRLRTTWQSIYLAHDHDLRFARTPMCPNIRWHTRSAGLDGETDGFKHAFDELRTLEFLHAKFAEIVDRIADGCDLIGVAFDHFICKFFWRARLGKRSGHYGP